MSFSVNDHLTNDQPCSDQLQWFAMRATYHREMAVKSLLDNAGIECYLPTAQSLKLNHGRKVRVITPLVSNLIFVRAAKERLQQFKARVPHLQYMTHRDGSKNVPIVVPERQMDDFISITASRASQLQFFSPGELNVKQGTRVRLHGGSLDGLEGVFMKVTGRRNRRLVIEVENVITVALECSDAEFVELI